MTHSRLKLDTALKVFYCVWYPPCKPLDWAARGPSVCLETKQLYKKISYSPIFNFLYYQLLSPQQLFWVTNFNRDQHCIENKQTMNKILEIAFPFYCKMKKLLVVKIFMKVLNNPDVNTIPRPPYVCSPVPVCRSGVIMEYLMTPPALLLAPHSSWLKQDRIFHPRVSNLIYQLHSSHVASFEHFYLQTSSLPSISYLPAQTKTRN